MLDCQNPSRFLIPLKQFYYTCKIIEIDLIFQFSDKILRNYIQYFSFKLKHKENVQLACVSFIPFIVLTVVETSWGIVISLELKE